MLHKTDITYIHCTQAVMSKLTKSMWHQGWIDRNGYRGC